MQMSFAVNKNNKEDNGWLERWKCTDAFAYGLCLYVQNTHTRADIGFGIESCRERGQGCDKQADNQIISRLAFHHFLIIIATVGSLTQGSKLTLVLFPLFTTYVH